MHQTVLAAFDGKQSAAAAVDALQNNADIAADQISLMMSDETRKLNLGTEGHSNVAEGTAVGGGFGLLIGGLAVLGALAVSGGTVLATGPLLVALGGLGLGAVGGGLTGALIGLGLPEQDAVVVKQHIEEGRIVVAVSTTDEAQAETAQRILTDLKPAAFRVFAAPTGEDQARRVAEARKQASQS